jgi:hypothetical protein
MPSHTTIHPSTFAPKAWSAICELSGGAHRLTPESDSWNDGFIVNLGSEEHEGEEWDPRKLDNWHVDGDFFVHFLDSPEQGLLVIPLWTDVIPNGGGTVICTEGVGEVARHLEAHPEGTGSGMIPRGDPNWESFRAGRGFYEGIVQRAKEESFHEMTGKAGDVILLHPFMLHSASWNGRRAVRIITNPPVSLREPFEYDPVDGDYSLVEKKTSRELGKERLEGWRIRGEREGLVPERVRVQERMREEEKRRLQELAKEGEGPLGATHMAHEIELGA